MSQAVLIYVLMACNVFVICWFGTQLTHHVRGNVLLLLFFLMLYAFTLIYFMALIVKILKKSKRGNYTIYEY